MTRALLLVVALLFALVGCASSTAPTTQPPVCRDVVHVVAGDLYVDGTALHDGVLTCRVAP